MEAEIAGNQLGQFYGPVDKRDKGTPDSWVSRHPELIRLTGRHPFNCEPTPKLLEEAASRFQGLTPSSLHYVRNHGPVPKLSWDTHKLEIGGMVKNPIELSMAELQKLPTCSIPVTLNCAGNRRKEQNMIKKSKGFSWGPCAVSTAVWSGVLLSDLLKLCGPLEGAQWVNFEGSDELPQGKYGTSLDINYAMSNVNDVLIAFGMNGELLSPDHGFPIRVLIPGFIGGRMVKWLKKIEVSSKESDSYYHYRDNRVLPPPVVDSVTAEEWWTKPEYIINDRNINSAILYPRHDQSFPIDPDKSINFKGYAYNGSGQKIIRVELSLDGGNSWKMANFKYGSPKGPRHGTKYWCWFLWTIKIPIKEIASSSEVCLRAWDCCQNTQPSQPTWNYLGMMNNPWYRVKFHQRDGEIVMEHPTDMLTGKGWMVRDYQERNKPKEEAVKSSLKSFTAAEVAKHNKEDDCWVIISGKVYDLSKFIKVHPGGKKAILIVAGQDATEDFEAIHGDGPKASKEKYCIGVVSGKANL
ncbi:hypothetical protein HK103_000802 [Boothiomyces macroporosus]|uniref:Nitrate reductase [NADPH] n=1 Tax=Boothiomyces macroporosus TaxID=261099 RepID=A0AAD5UC08_9FUNG|nr:hypothetical protein HK103_000802 [Boothiomyces macroporosus]